MDSIFRRPVKLEKVKDLIEWLEILGRDRPLVYCYADNTDSVYTSDVDDLNECVEDSAVAIKARQI